MTAKLAAVDSPPPKSRATAKRSPIKVAITAEVVDADGKALSFPQGSKLKVLKVYRDMNEYADAITEDPLNMPLFAKLEVPFQS